MNDAKAIDGLLADVPELSTIEEVASLLRVTVPTVTLWAAKYGLTIITVGPRTRRVRKDDLRTFLLHGDELSEGPNSKG